MATLKVDGLTVSVKGYYLNNNSPYHQVFVPKQLRLLFGQHKASVVLYGENKRQHIDQCQQLNQRFRALFCSVRNNRSQAPKSLHFVAQAWLSEISAEIDANTVDIPVLLSDAFELYVKNHENGSDKRFRAKQFAHWQRFMHLAGNGSLKSSERRFLTFNGKATVEIDYQELHPTILYELEGLTSLFVHRFAGMPLLTTVGAGSNIKNRWVF